MKNTIVIHEHPSNEAIRKKIINKCKNTSRAWGWGSNSPGEKRRIKFMFWLYGVNKPNKRKKKRLEKRLGKKIIFEYK